MCFNLFNIHLFTFSNGDPAFGIMTLTLPFLPSIVATAMERNCKTFIRHLPVAQLWTHQKMLRRITTLQNDMAQWKALLTRLKDDNSMTKQLVDDIRKWIEDVEELTVIANDEAHVVYSLFTKAICHRWTYHHRTIRGTFCST